MTNEMHLKKIEIEPRLFVKGLVAKLVTKGVTEIKTNEATGKFNFIISYLTSEINLTNKEKIGEEKYYALVHLRNELQPSLSGAFDYFEYHLRMLQNSYTEVSATECDCVKLTVPREFAESFLIEEFSGFEKDLIENSAEAYLKSA